MSSTFFEKSFGALCAAGSVTLSGLGIEEISMGFVKKNAALNSFYSNVERITPEVIEQANDLAVRVGDMNYITGTFILGAAGSMGALAYYFIRGAS